MRGDRVVTAVIDSMTFEQPVYVGNLVTLHAMLTWTGRTSLETEVTIHAEDLLSGVVRHISTGVLRLRRAPTNTAARRRCHRSRSTTPEQRRRWQAAEQRRAVRLGTSGGGAAQLT